MHTVGHSQNSRRAHIFLKISVYIVYLQQLSYIHRLVGIYIDVHVYVHMYSERMGMHMCLHLALEHLELHINIHVEFVMRIT